MTEMIGAARPEAAEPRLLADSRSAGGVAANTGANTKAGQADREARNPRFAKSAHPVLAGRPSPAAST